MSIHCSSCDTSQGPLPPKAQPLFRMVLLAVLGFSVWFLLYQQLLPFSEWLVFSLLGLNADSHSGQALQFFFYDTPKVLMLLGVVVFAVGILRSFVTVAWTRRVLADRQTLGNILAALLGIVTPFCSCSAVPLFIGFMTAGVPLGVTFSFLISAPMVNEIALILLYGLLGWKIAAIYMGTGLFIAIISGWIMGKMHLENHVEDWVMQIRAGEAADPNQAMTLAERLEFAADSVREIVGRVWKFVILGIAVGAGIHGYVPAGYLAGIMGNGSWWSVPLSVLIGIPMYSNAAGIVPVVEALLGKGAALGTVLAFMMAVIALSFPEMVILRKVLKPRLIGIFIGVVGSGIMLVGYLFNAIM